MIVSVAKALLTMAVALFAVIGAATSTVIGLLVADVITVGTVAAAVSSALAYANICAGGLGLTTAGTITRAMVPHIVTSMKGWFENIIRSQIKEELR